MPNTVKPCSLYASSDTPKILGLVATYTWEGNPANLSCEVEAHPGASVVWFRDGIQLPSPNATNLKIYNTPTVSYLEVMNPPSLSSSAPTEKGKNT